MLGLIQEQARRGDPEAIRTLEMLKTLGFIKDEPEEAREPMVWELLDQCMRGSKRYRKKRWTTN